MFACPKCDYRLPTCWHSYRWITDMFYCRVEDFNEEKEYEKFWGLEKGAIVEDKSYYYRRTIKNGRFVLMWPKVLGKEYYKTRHFERFKAPRDFGLRPGQRDLDPFVSTGEE